jgi:hypothetical protein
MVILPYFPCDLKMKLRLEVLFKKFHARINLTTLFSTKSYLLNTIKPFSTGTPKFTPGPDIVSEGTRLVGSKGSSLIYDV